MKELERTIKALCKKRPVLEPILANFSELLAERKAVASELAESFSNADLTLPQFDLSLAEKGAPCLAGRDLSALKSGIVPAATKLLPLLAKQSAIAPWNQKLTSFYQESGFPLQLLYAILAGADNEIEKIGEKSGLPVGILLFSADFILSACLRALVQQEDHFAWDESEGYWTQGYCPVCGSQPSLAWLEKPQIDENNAFIVGGGGKKHLHCSFCGASWKFARRRCPACNEAESLLILKEKGEAAERLEYCEKCNTYCPTIDLRELIYTPDLDVLAIGMLHLDMLSQERNLRPLRQSFWNSF